MYFSDSSDDDEERPSSGGGGYFGQSSTYRFGGGGMGGLGGGNKSSSSFGGTAAAAAAVGGLGCSSFGGGGGMNKGSSGGGFGGTSLCSKHTIQHDAMATQEFEREIKRIKIEKMDPEESRLQLKHSLREAEEQQLELKRKLQEEKEKLRTELENKKKMLSLLDKGRRKVVEKLDKLLRERFRREKRERDTLTDRQLAKFKTMTSNYFEMKKVIFGSFRDGVIKFTVNKGGYWGFSLQNFFDENYVSTKKYDKKLVNTRFVLFEDDPDMKIAKAVLSTWDIVYEGDYTLESNGKQHKSLTSRIIEAANYVLGGWWVVARSVGTCIHTPCSLESNEEGTAVDQGGPSCQFLTDIFKQIETLSVKVGNESVKLFESTESGVHVVTDDLLKYYIARAVKKSGADESAAIKQAKDYVRAIGRIMLHSMAHEYILPAKAMSPFFMTVIFHGYDETYHRDDIIQHIGMSKSITDSLSEEFFAETIPAAFIHSRKMLLGSLQDGLTIGGCSSPDAPTDIAMGCGLARDLFFSVPLEAIRKKYFSMPTFSVEDLLAIIVPEYGSGADHPDVKLTEAEKAKLIQQQKIFFNGNFKKYLEESAKEDDNFLVKFVECVTGYNYLPYGGSNQIQIEFSFAKTEGLPDFHTCSRDLVIPGYEYYWSDYKEFKDVKMNQTIDAVYNQFVM